VNRVGTALHPAGELDGAPLWAGESVEMVRTVEPAAAIVRRLLSEADAVMTQVAPQHDAAAAVVDRAGR
jgi:hypothetical protein